MSYKIRIPKAFASNEWAGVQRSVRIPTYRDNVRLSKQQFSRACGLAVVIGTVFVFWRPSSKNKAQSPSNVDRFKTLPPNAQILLGSVRYNIKKELAKLGDGGRNLGKERDIAKEQLLAQGGITPYLLKIGDKVGIDLLDGEYDSRRAVFQ